MSRYAEGTPVTVQQSRGEITGILAKHGVETMAWGTKPGGDYLRFELGGRAYLFHIEKPTTEQIFELYPNHRDTEAKLEAEWRRRWRANVLLLKAKLEFADGETSTVERELMPYMLLKGGKTLEQIILAGTLPLLAPGGAE